MYNAHNPIPAPYEFNRQSAPVEAPALAHGGSAHGKLTPAHMSKHELDILEHLQGGKHVSHGMRSLAHLEHVLKNPHIRKAVHAHTHRRRHAAGGSATPDYSAQQVRGLASGGRNGDTEMALIGPHTQTLFNQLAGHPTHNPSTGYPEYFSLGDTLSGLWDGIKGVGSTIWDGVKGALPAIGKIGGTALGGYLGGPAGAGVGASLGGALGDSLGGGGQEHSPQSQGISQSIGSGLQAMQGGASPYQALGQVAQGIGSQYGGGAGSALQGMGNAMSNNQGFGNALQQGGRQGFQSMGGMQGLQNMGQNAFQNARQGFQDGGFSGAMQGGFNSARNSMNDMQQQFMPQNNGRQGMNMPYGRTQQPQGMQQYGGQDYGRQQQPQFQDNYSQQSPYGYSQGGYGGY